jgi:hypothetical protein
MLAAMSSNPVLQAANDNNFLPPRHRTLPITSSITPILNYPSKLRIFKTNASKFWQVRCYLRGKTYTQSLRTVNKASAISLAKQFFHVKTAELYGEHVKVREDRAVLFSDIVSATLAQQQARVERGELTALSLSILRSRLHKTILPFFGTMSLESINYQHLTDFLQKLNKQGLSPTSIQQHLVATRKVFSYAHGMNLIRSLPKFPAVKIKSQPRGSFTVEEYRSLVSTARKLIGETIPTYFTAKSRRGQRNVENFGRVSQDLSWLIRFMVNGFMRPSDIKFLQHQHVTIVRGKHIYLRLNLPETKKHDKPIVTLQAAVYVYERLLAWQSANGYGQPTDYLFLPEQPNRELVLETYRWQFNYIQQHAGIGKNAANGQHRTLYSLRHSSMTFRLLYGKQVDLLTLARNARTSVEMVEKFYSSNLAPEMNIDLLQGKRGEH